MMMKKTQKLVLYFEKIRVEVRFDGLSEELQKLAVKLYDETAAWQADGLAGAPTQAVAIDGICVTMMWDGDVPKVKPRVTEIFGVPVSKFMAKQYK